MFPSVEDLEREPPPTSFVSEVGVTLSLPKKDASLGKQEELAKLVHGMVASGESLSVAMGNDGKLDAMDFLSQPELVMLDRWERGQGMPRINWDTIQYVVLPNDESRQSWARHADALNDMYAVEGVDEQNAMAWWTANEEWRPLVSAYGTVKKCRMQAESAALYSVLEHLQAYSKFVNSAADNYAGTMHQHRFVFRERLKYLENVYNKHVTLSIPDPAPDGIYNLEPEPDAEDMIEVVDETGAVPTFLLDIDPESPQFAPDANGHAPISPLLAETLPPTSDVPEPLPTTSDVSRIANGASSPT